MRASGSLKILRRTYVSVTVATTGVYEQTRLGGQVRCPPRRLPLAPLPHLQLADRDKLS